MIIETIVRHYISGGAMRQRLRHEVLIGVIAVLFVILSPLSSFGYTVNYTYDDAYRLTQIASSSGFGETYTYDEVGNRLTSEVTFTPDTTPDPFAFENISNVAPNTLVESNTITISGINTPASLSISGGEYAVSADNGATWSPYSNDTPATVTDNTLVKVRQMSAGTYAATTVITITIGGVSSPFSVTTIADTTPPVSAILTPENGTGIMNTSFTIDGAASDIGSSVSKVEISINGGNWTQATGTTNWIYQWTNIAPGTYTIQSRATDGAGNVEVPGAGITVHVYAYTPSNISISGRALTVNSQSFTIRGINYSPVPIGQDPYNPPYGDYYTSAYSSILTRDLPQIRQMGANTIRLWIWDTEADHRDFLDMAYNSGTNPIYVIAGYNINPGLDLTDQTIRETIKEDFRAMVQTHRDHPAILIWAIGNDLNATGNYGPSPVSLFSLIQEMATEAHALDPFHPVMMPLADETLIETITSYEASVPSLNIWGANVYRGNSFGNLFSTYQAASSKPLLITGYGIDAYNDTTMTEDQNVQASYASSLWNEIVANRATTIGGVYMEYSDQWWAGILSLDVGCPEPGNPAVHGDCGMPAASMPDGYDNFEWWGVMRAADAGAAPDTLTHRQVYTTLMNLWNALPDLAISYLINPGAAGAGTTITVTDTTTNNGPGFAGASTTKFYLSTNGALDAGDTYLGSRSVGALAAGESNSGSVSVIIPAPTVTGTYYIIAIADADNAVAEIHETDNLLYRMIRIGPDLAISYLINPGAAGAGTTITVTDTTTNNGPGFAGASTTKFYLSTNGALDAGDTYLGSRSVGALAAGESNSGSVSVIIPAPTVTGTYYIIAVADADNAVAEIHETDNLLYRMIRIGPDLVISVMAVPATGAAGSNITVTETTRNDGPGAAGPSTTKYYLSTNGALDAGDTYLGMRAVPALAAGETSSGSVTVTIPAGTTAGRWYIISKADADGAVAEIYETDNTQYRSITVQ